MTTKSRILHLWSRSCGTWVNVSWTLINTFPVKHQQEEADIWTSTSIDKTFSPRILALLLDHSEFAMICDWMFPPEKEIYIQCHYSETLKLLSMWMTSICSQIYTTFSMWLTVHGVGWHQQPGWMWRNYLLFYFRFLSQNISLTCKILSQYPDFR